MKTMNGVHRVALRLTGGRFGWNLLGMPVVELTTTGRKSGQPRSVMLTSPLQEGSTFVVVASRGGDDNPPAWLLNIEASGDVQVATNGGEPQPYRARVATAEERARMWPRLTADHKNYAGYQKKTSREIPLVLLTPA
jgi:deazaflavin-dependent oxidoreductase (nitroreductase family)